ncbi:unnamed protein product [Lampetra fluviatilis]
MNIQDAPEPRPHALLTVVERAPPALYTRLAGSVAPTRFSLGAPRGGGGGASQGPERGGSGFFSPAPPARDSSSSCR